MRQLIEVPRPASERANQRGVEALTQGSIHRGWSLEHVDETHPSRSRAQAFIHDAYARAFGADIATFYPSILTLSNDQASLLGALGARWAGGQDLFLERYLDRPVCELIEGRTGIRVGRKAIVELGNLALGRPRVTHTFMSLIGAWLQDFQVDWLVCALTKTLRRMFERAGVELLHLAPARPERLGDEAITWGNYYRHDPVIVAIELAPSLLHFNHSLGISDTRGVQRLGAAG